MCRLFVRYYTVDNSCQRSQKIPIQFFVFTVTSNPLLFPLLLGQTGEIPYPVVRSVQRCDSLFLPAGDGEIHKSPEAQ